MYFSIFFLMLVCITCLVVGAFRSEKAIPKIRKMDECRKYHLLNEIMRPFGFTYVQGQDVMSSALDAWQKEFGYSWVFDETAVHFNMVFDCEPVYFEYENRTWLIEFWKGQYGINTGAEVGIYRADSVLTPEDCKGAWFQSVPDSEMFPISFKLYKRNKELFCVKQKHWWLTGFDVGRFSWPDNLSMKICILFPEKEMQQSFVKSLLKLGYREDELCICGRMVCFWFDVPHSEQPRSLTSGKEYWAQWKNRLFCRLFDKITHPFGSTADRVLYLYFLLPSAFRRTLRFRKNQYLKKGRKG